MSNESTTDEVVIYQLNDTGDEEILVTVPPGLTRGLGTVGDCTQGELVARLQDGTEVERRPPGLCEDDVWRINEDPSD